ncbi:MAG: CsgG/HfaB family protein [Treponema sp.]|nr:CsgG/HfaB family protein [Treponema sp.]
MKRNCLIVLFSIFFCFTCFAETVVVLDFDTEIIDYENNASVMSDMLRSELVKTKKINIIDRKSMNAAINEIQSQMSDYMSNENVKQLGKMLNADYLVIGHVLSLSNKSASSPTSNNIFLNKAEKILIGDDKVEVVVQLIEIETLKVLSSTSVELKKWTDFSNYTKKMAYDLVTPILKGDKISSEVLTNIQKANEDMLEGTWTTELVHDGITDYYTVIFNENHKVTVSIISKNKKGKQTKSEGSGRYIFNDNEKILSITINSLNGDIKHLTSLNWKAYINPGSDELSFSYNIPITSDNNSKVMKCDFYKE